MNGRQHPKSAFLLFSQCSQSAMRLTRGRFSYLLWADSAAVLRQNQRHAHLQLQKAPQLRCLEFIKSAYRTIAGRGPGHEGALLGKADAAGILSKKTPALSANPPVLSA